MSGSRKNAAGRTLSVLYALLALVILFPVLYTVSNSFMSPSEVMEHYGMIASERQIGTAGFHFFPDRFSLRAYYNTLLARPEYLVKFWNSLFLCGSILLGQVVISCMGGLAFAKYKFKGHKLLFFLFILLMLMPVQVTLLPNYIMLDNLRLLDSWWALILPAAFSPFGVFLMTQVFRGIPTELDEAARLDGANTMQVLWKVMVPAGKGGVISLIILGFIDAWNMVEQPIVFLKNFYRYPLSVFLASMNAQNFSLQFACGVLAMLPVILLFLFFREELTEGIEFSGLK